MIPARACQACGVELVTQRAGDRYCDDTCRQRAHRRTGDHRQHARQSRAGSL